MRWWGFITGIRWAGPFSVSILLGLAVSAPSAEPPLPQPYQYLDQGLGEGIPRFTLNESGGLPDRLSLAIQHRTRYETLNHPFRAGATGSDQALSLRTLVQAGLQLHPDFRIQFEFQDARALNTDSGTPLSTSVVNTAELLEANLQWRPRNWFQEGSRALVRAGRLTMDVGTRRLVARNRFRNTKNAFTGVDALWQSGTGTRVRALFTLPVDRLPTSQAELLDNQSAFDRESFDRLFWGVFLEAALGHGGDRGELYLFGLHERDRANQPTRNRRLFTPGLRVYRTPAPGRFDYEWETILQFGRSRASAAAGDTRDLDHAAHFHHVEMGYSWQAPGSPHLALAYDYASGDSDPLDGSNGNFDPLFGATVFDFGPTGIFRAFIRSNVTGPAVKLTILPLDPLTLTLHYRALWLASSRDAWAGNSGLSDPSGGSGSFLGQMLFFSAGWQALPNLKLEAGLAYRIDGDYQDRVSGAPNEGNTRYGFVSTTLAF